MVKSAMIPSSVTLFVYCWKPIVRYLFIFLWFLVSCNSAQKPLKSPVPETSRQMVVVISPSFQTSEARLYRFQRENGDKAWMNYSEPIPAIVGKNGMGWGRGLHTLEGVIGPVKREGDGKSPAGVFSLSTAFGFADPVDMTALKLPYVHIREMVECVDDPGSVHYNAIVHREEVERVDWHSSERMWRAKTWYEQGVVVDHNRHPGEPHAGSCIFLHNWANPRDSTSGCTALDPRNMQDILYWLDATQNPVLVQVPEEVYAQVKAGWGLPDLGTVKPKLEESEPPQPDNTHKRVVETWIGMDMRAVGNEPGWILELSARDSIMFATDYGRRTFRFETPLPDIDPESGKTVYRLNQGGDTFMVIVESRPCQDSMSGKTFEFQVTVILNEQKWTGCGKKLPK